MSDFDAILSRVGGFDLSGIVDDPVIRRTACVMGGELALSLSEDEPRMALWEGHDGSVSLTINLADGRALKFDQVADVGETN